MHDLGPCLRRKFSRDLAAKVSIRTDLIEGFIPYASSEHSGYLGASAAMLQQLMAFCGENAGALQSRDTILLLREQAIIYSSVLTILCTRTNAEASGE